MQKSKNNVRKKRIYSVIFLMGLLIIITLTISTQNLVAKDVQASYSKKINLSSQKIYRVENEVIIIVKWNYHSDVDVLLLYMSGNEISWFNDPQLSYMLTFSERLRYFQNHLLSERDTEGSGFKDLSSSQNQYFVVIASFGTGELEYALTYYNSYFDYQIVLNVLTVIIVMIGSFYVLVEISILKTGEIPKKENKIYELNPTYKASARQSKPTFRYCKNCGIKLDRDALYCHNCGKKFR